jgi:hypothetical protein
MSGAFERLQCIGDVRDIEFQSQVMGALLEAARVSLVSEARPGEFIDCRTEADTTVAAHFLHGRHDIVGEIDGGSHDK